MLEGRNTAALELRRCLSVGHAAQEASSARLSKLSLVTRAITISETPPAALNLVREALPRFLWSRTCHHELAPPGSAPRG